MSTQSYPSDREAKQMIIAMGRSLYERGLVAAADGNMSCKVSESTLWTTPSGEALGTLTENLLVKMHVDGSLLSSDTDKPSSEILMHLALYRACPETGGIMHAHPPAGTAFALAGSSALDSTDLYPAAIATLGPVPCAPYVMPGTQELADSLLPYFPDHHALLLANHGAVTWGQTLKEAFFRMETLEHYARILLYSKQLTNNPKTLTNTQINALLAESRHHA